MEKLFFTSFTEDEFRDIIKQCLKEEVGKIKIMPESQKYPIAHLSVKDLTVLLGVSKVTIGSWVKKGILKAYKIGNKRIYFKKEEVEAVLKHQDAPIKHLTRFGTAAQQLDDQVWLKIKNHERKEGIPIEHQQNPEAERLKFLRTTKGKNFHD
jgi:excisionase family DNA binding protein